MKDSSDPLFEPDFTGKGMPLMVTDRWQLIERLTGIHSSKKSYYVELKKKILETARRNTELEVINELAKSINIEMSLEEIVERAEEKLRQLVQFDLLSLYTLEDGKLYLRTSSPPGETILARQGERLSEKSVFWKVIQTKRPVVRNNVAGDSAEYEEDASLTAAGFKSVALVPLLARERAIGVFVLKSKKEDAYSRQDLRFLEQVADQLTICLKNSWLYAEVYKSKREWETTFDAVTDLIVFIDREFNIIRFNKAVPAFYKVSPEDLAGKKCYQVFFRSRVPCHGCPAKDAIATLDRAYQQMRLPSGEVLDVNAYPAIDENGRLIGAITYSKDVTRIVSSSKLVALGEMAAGVAHELNSPLTAIVGDAQLLLRDLPESDPKHELLQDIKNCGLRCKRIIQNLLAFSRQDEYSFELLSINDVVERTLALVSYQIEKSNITIAKELSPEIKPVMGNSQRLEQIILNLLLNARDSFDGQGNKKRRIRIGTLNLPRDEVGVFVCDNGSGIPPELLSQIFNPFFTTKKPGKGTGLGLSVSLGIAEAHGGRIEVKSTPGKGSTFTLILPAADSKPTEHQASGGM